MKKFVLGALCATIVFSLSISALAISGRMTIEVSPINIQVNGQTFVPKDVNGAEVPVFAYNGTTYAPLRALAEAYGLVVGYDQATNMATVVDPEAPAAPADDAKTTFGSDWSAEKEAEYQEFKAMWDVESRSHSEHDGMTIHQLFAHYKGDADEGRNIVEAYKSNDRADFLQRLVIEYQGDDDQTDMYFMGGDALYLKWSVYSAHTA